MSGFTIVLKRLVRWLSGLHKCSPVHGQEFDILGGRKTCDAVCPKCGAKFTGIYEQGELSKEWFWVYVKHT